MLAKVNFSLFTFHFSLFFVPLHLIRVSKNSYLKKKNYDQQRTH